MKRGFVVGMAVFFIALGAVVISLMSCGGGGGNGAPSTGTVNTSISDPPICKSPIGSIDKVWVTITRVRAHISENAAPNDGGWVELLDLRQAPRQIDLLNLDSTTCVLTQLGSTSGLPAGQYQQIRLYLLSNSPGPGEVTPSANENECGTSGYNCVVSGAGAITQTLLLSSEAQTGIKIPSGQIAGGKFTVLGGQSVDLNIDFDACSSIVQQGNGQYRLKPVLHAGEVGLNNNSISGRVVEVVNGTSVPIPNAMVLVEKSDSLNIDRVLMQKTTGQDGRFIFCPLSSGTYDIVAAATNLSKTYSATVTLAVPLGANMGDIPLVPQSVVPTEIAPAQINGRITSAANTVDISLSALQAVGGTNPLMVTIPLFANSTPTNTTAAGGTCALDTICADYTLFVPAGNPQVGTFSATPPTSYTPPASAPVFYRVNAQAFAPGSGGTPDCSPSSLLLPLDTNPGIVVTPGNITTQNFSFTGCDGVTP